MTQRVPWTVTRYYDGGRLGHVGVCSSSPTAEEAIVDAKRWARDHPGEWRNYWFLSPSTTITINNRNWITGDVHDYQTT